jgi:hypothetical protein
MISPHIRSPELIRTDPDGSPVLSWPFVLGLAVLTWSGAAAILWGMWAAGRGVGIF